MADQPRDSLANQEPSANAAMPRDIRATLRGLLVLASLVAIGFLVKETGLATLLDESWIDANIRDKGLRGDLLFLAVGGLFTGVGLPRQFISFLGGYAFGFVEGTALAVAATGLGCVGSFYYARLMGRALVVAKFPNRVRKVDVFLSHAPFSMTVLIRLMPFGSNIITNLVAGVTNVSALLYVSASVLGYIPQTMVFALVGSGINVDPTFRIAISVVLFLVSGGIGIFLYRKIGKAREAAQALTPGDA